jgi:hypothetical protein
MESYERVSHCAVGLLLLLAASPFLIGCDGTVIPGEPRDDDDPPAEVEDGGPPGDDDDGSGSGSGEIGRDAAAPPAVPSFCAQLVKHGDWVSSRVSYGSDGKLAYTVDAEKNRIPDFSYAGYRYGAVEPPAIAQVATLSPTSGDQTNRIQQALDAVGARTPDGNGFRGALVLAPGRYQVDGTVRVSQSGVVLRGAGDGSDETRATILVAHGDSPHQRSVVVVGSGNGSPWKRGAGTEISDGFLGVGALTVTVKDASLFKVGDRVIINHPSTQAWLDAIAGGDTGADPRWSPGSIDVPYFRIVTAIAGNQLGFDAPIYHHLERALAVASVYKASGGPLYRVAVENLRVDIESAGATDENHAWDAIVVKGAEDAWVRGVTALHFGHAAVMTQGARRVTVVSSHAADPVGIRTGGRFYDFDAEGNSQLILFKDVDARGGRHNFISNGAQSASGIVFLRSSSDGGDTEGHRHWSQALLFDNNTDKGTERLDTRRDWGTGHGWASVHSVIWNDHGRLLAQKPPTGQNYAISAFGKPGSAPFSAPGGFTELKSGTLSPPSLYEAQLCERLGH